MNINSTTIKEGLNYKILETMKNLIEADQEVKVKAKKCQRKIKTNDLLYFSIIDYQIIII